MGDVGNWILGGCALVLALCGLFVSSHAGSGVGYYGGLAMFALGILFILHLMRVSSRHE